MGISILIIAYKRPQYLSKVLESLTFIDYDELFFSFEYPSNDDAELVQECIKLGNNYSFPKKFFNIETEKKLGCKGHVLKALNWVVNNAVNDFILILEDDILLTEKTADRVEKYVNTYNNNISVLKLNDFFWGWVARKDIINELLNGIDDYIEEYTACNYEPSKLMEYKEKYEPIFKNVNQVVLLLEPIKLGVYLPWDEQFDLIMKLKDIVEVKDGIKYVDNIGQDSSRDMGKESDYYGSAALRYYVKNGQPIFY